jgi:hypothetical protein
MKRIELENFASDLAGCSVKILLQTVSGKWYEQKYTSIFTVRILF